MTTNGRFWVKQAKKRERTGPDRAFLLCRQSITRKQSISLDDQERHNAAYAEQQGYEVVAVRKSPNVKGWKEERADHDYLRTLAVEGEIDVVVSYDVSRTARTVRLLEVLAHDLERNGVRLEFSSQPFANTPQGRQMLGMFAELETAHRSVRLRDTWDTLRRMGRWHGKAPYGYRREDRTILPEPPEDEIARRILRLPFAGKGSVAIRDTLNAEGVPTRSGVPWDETMISRLLRNPAYAGAMVIDGETTWPPEGCQWHEPLIPRDEWEHLQTILPTYQVTRSKPVASWIEELVQHACGARMYLVATSTPRGTLLPVYRCRLRYKTARCRLVHGDVSARNLETAARAAILSDFANRRSYGEVVREIVAGQKLDGSLDARRAVAKQRAAVLAERDRAETLHIRGKRSADWFDEQDAGFKTRIAALDAEEQRLPRPANDRDLREISETLDSLADAIAEASPERIAMGMRAMGIVAVVGEGGVRMAYPPTLARLLREPVTVKIPRARTRSSSR